MKPFLRRNDKKKTKLRSRFSAILALLVLAACGSTVPEPVLKPRHTHHTQPKPPAQVQEPVQYSADAYLLHLSLAELTLEGNPDVVAAAADYDIASAYTNQKQADKVLQPVIIVEYSLKGHKAHKRIAIPFAMPHDNDEFPDVGEAMSRLGNLSYTLYDLHVGVVSLPASEPLGPEGTDHEVALKRIDDRLQPLARKVQPFPPMVQARIGLQLTRYCMKHQYKEPAYLAIDNAKRSLANVGDAEATRSLSSEIDAQEDLLYKTMPFTFDF